MAQARSFLQWAQGSFAGCFAGSLGDLAVCFGGGGTFGATRRVGGTGFGGGGSRVRSLALGFKTATGLRSSMRGPAATLGAGAATTTIVCAGAATGGGAAEFVLQNAASAPSPTAATAATAPIR
jgi:hypothetical protein